MGVTAYVSKKGRKYMTKTILVSLPILINKQEKENVNMTKVRQFFHLWGPQSSQPLDTS
jgi:hypothetical protein